MNPIFKGLAAVGGVALVIVFVVGLFLLGPAILIWSVNTLANEAGLAFFIPFNFWTWLAGFCLILVLNGGIKSSQ